MIHKKIFLLAMFLCMRVCAQIHNETGFIDTNTAQLWYTKYFTENAKNETPLVVVHGGPCFPHNYLLPLQEIASVCPVIFYDQSGCGQSSKIESSQDISFEYYVQELTQCIDALGYNKIYLLGHSWGGALAIAYTANNPHKVAKLILASPLINTQQWVHDTKQYIGQLPTKIANIIMSCEAQSMTETQEYHHAMMHFYRKHFCRLDAWPINLNESFNLMNMVIYKQLWGPSEFTVTGNLATLQLTHRLPALTMPVLLTCGAYDQTPPGTMQKISALLQNGELLIFENSSHNAHLEEPAKYVAKIKEFLMPIELALLFGEAVVARKK